MPMAAEYCVTWVPPQLNPAGLDEHAVVTLGNALEVPQTLATAQDSQQRHQQQFPAGNADPARHAEIGDLPQNADQVEIWCANSGFGHGVEAIMPSTDADCYGHGTCDTP
jgi:hypothetical protein